MSIKTRFAGILLALSAILSFGAPTANAQPDIGRATGQQKEAQPVVQLASATTALVAKACTPNFWYISGNGVRIRKQPGGAIVGHANYGERVDIFWRSGVWVYVYFKGRPLYVHPRAGYVHQDYVQYHQPTCR